MTLLGLPVLTALFVFGGFLVAVVASIVFAVMFKPVSDRWMTVEDLFRRRSAPIQPKETAQRR
jgi:hypothetical protein